jgi:glycosyltransferase involved in cell wall biosynthesis
VELVSVVIPAYNTEPFIGSTVSSVLAQTHTELELIVVDDGSTDRTVENASRFPDPRLRIITQSNAGVAQARNRGIEASRGLYVALLDADDTWLPHKLSTQIAALTANPTWGAVGGLMHHISSSGRPLGVAGFPIGEAERATVAAARLMPFPLSSILIRREALDEVGPFDESLQRDVPGQVEDLDFVARLAAVAGLGCVPEILGGYRVHKGSASARHYRSQAMGVRFLAARVAERQRGQELTFAEFLRSNRFSLRTWRVDTAAYSYRAAGLSVADRHLVVASLYAAQALLLDPARFLRRLRHQRGALFRRSRLPSRVHR